MSLIGSVSLTEPQDGIYLGRINVDNFNLQPDQIAYSVDGINLSGLNLGDGLQKTLLNELETIGNSEIQLVSNSLYVNDNVQSIQSKIDVVTQGDVIYVSSGSYGETQININNKYNFAIQCPDVGNTITEVLNGVNIDGTSELIRISNLQVKPSSTTSTVIKGVGRHYFKNVVFSGSLTQSHVIELGKLTTKYMTFMNCEFDQYCQITISSQLSAPIYFINCNFGGATITYSNLSPLLVIMSNCAGLVSYPASNKATLVGVNVLASGSSNLTITNINGSAYPPPSSGVSVTNQTVQEIPFCTATNNVLDCNSNFTYDSGLNKLSVVGGQIIAGDVQTSSLGASSITATDLTITNINGSAYPPASSGVSILVQGEGQIPYCTANSNELTSDINLMWFPSQRLLSTNIGEIDCQKISFLKYIKLADGTESQNNTNKVLTSDGVAGFKFEENGGNYSILCNNFLSGQQTVKSGISIDLFNNNGSGFGNKFPEFPTIFTCIFNFSTSSNNCILTLQLNDNFTIASYTQSLSRNGHHNISVTFLLQPTGNYDYQFAILASVDNGTISTDANDYYSIKVEQPKGNLPLL
jgi:hypothetical protein